MKTLILMRHAHAKWDDDRWSDFDRPLTPTGEAQAPQVGMKVAKHGVSPDRILCSSALRTQQTADYMANALEYEEPIQSNSRLYLCAVSVWEQTISNLNPDWDSVLLVGHNDGLEHLVSYLSRRHVHVPPAGLAMLQLEDWSGFHRSVQPISLEVWLPE